MTFLLNPSRGQQRSAPEHYRNPAGHSSPGHKSLQLGFTLFRDNKYAETSLRSQPVYYIQVALVFPFLLTASSVILK